MTKPDPNTIKTRAKLGPVNRKAPLKAQADLTEKQKVRLITAAVMEGKSEADIVRACLDAGLDDLGY